MTGNYRTSHASTRMAANWKFELMLLELRAATVDPKETYKCLQSGHSRPYSITLSALIRSDCGMVRPNVFAVLRLINNSNFVGC